MNLSVETGQKNSAAEGHGPLPGRCGRRVLALAALLAGLAVLPGCGSFQHLTELPPDNASGPRASECGECHRAQFSQWSLSAHARAYSSAGFQAMADGDSECLACHAPLGIRNGETRARAFNLAEGVTCISCHLSDGAMHGPHRSSALLQPHPVKAEDASYLSTDFCAVCHGETRDEYPAPDQASASPACLECHARALRHTASQGSNLFSNFLVSFEDEVETRSHEITLEAMADSPDRFQLRPRVQAEGQATRVEVRLTNRLPHNLPTGTHGAKTIRLDLRLMRGGVAVADRTLPVADEDHALAPGGEKTLAAVLPVPLARADGLEIRLVRRGDADSGRRPVIIARWSVPLPDRAGR